MQGEKDKPIRQIVYKSRTENVDEEIKPEEMVKGYAYGKQLVPFSRADEDATKYKSKQCLELIGFVPQDGVNAAQFLDAADIALPHDDDARGATAMSALVNAMLSTKTFALARYVKRDGDGPVIVCLSPHTERDPRGRLLECLIVNTLPFAEDLRPFRFKSLATVEVRQDQLDAADNLIDSMDLSCTNASGGEVLAPETTFNPTLQFFYDCLSKRARDKDCKVVKTSVLETSSSSSPPLPSGPPTLAPPVGTFGVAARDAVARFKAAFPTTEKVSGSNKRRHWGANRNASERGTDASSSSSLSSSSSSSSSEHTSAADGSNKRRRLESVDFDAIGKKFDDTLAKAMEGEMDLANLAMEALRDAIENASFREEQDAVVKAVEHVPGLIGKLRSGSIACYEVAWFNTWVKGFKAHCAKGGHEGVWSAVAASGNGLIKAAESDGDATGVAPEAAQKFLSDPLLSAGLGDAAASEEIAVAQNVIVDDDMDLDDDLD